MSQVVWTPKWSKHVPGTTKEPTFTLRGRDGKIYSTQNSRAGFRLFIDGKELIPMAGDNPRTLQTAKKRLERIEASERPLAEGEVPIIL